ncbi:MAG: hypothetical protein ACFCD0_13070 [Gemmataceae bacterium]
MIHDLSLGYFDPESIRQGHPAVTKPLDLHIVHRLLREDGDETRPGEFTLGKHPVAITDGCVTCPRLPSPLRAAFCAQGNNKTKQRTQKTAKPSWNLLIVEIMPPP